MSLNVLLNVQSLTPPLTGIGRYTLELLRALSGSSSIESLQCFSEWDWIKPEKVLQQSAVDLPQNPPAARFRGLVRSIPGAYPLRCRVRDFAFSLRVRSFGTSVYHEPNYVLRPFSGPRVLTAHDISHLRYPAFHPIERVRFLEKRLPGSLAQADQVITVSDFSKREIVDCLGVPREKITAIPLGVDSNCHPRNSEETMPLLRVLGLDHGCYLLVVATMEPRKNLLRLVRAFSDLPNCLRERYPLVIAGAPGWGPHFSAPGLATLEACGQIRRLGYVSETALPLLYAGAGAFAFPSLYEGFGLPPLEALASGVPVLTSSAASMPEVVGNAALLINPEDTSDIGRGLQRLLTDEDFRRKAEQAGPEQAAGYTWDRCAKSTIAIYYKARGR